MAKFTARQQQVMELMGEDATRLLSRHGIEVKGPNAKGFLNLSACPWCKHGEARHDNYQCGVAQTKGQRGYLHSFKCFHPHDGPTGEDAPHYADILAQMGELTLDEAAWVKNLKTSSGATKLANQDKKSPTAPGQLNGEHSNRLSTKLKADLAAMSYLQTTRGYSIATIERFRLGLNDYVSKDTGEVVYTKALCAPLMGSDGQFYSKYVNYAMPGITVDNRDKQQRAWSSGPARTYYSGSRQNKTELFVCDGLKDVWALYQALEGTDRGKKMLIISSTNGGQGHPDEWKQPEFWDKWEAVYLGHDNDRPDEKTGRKAGDMHAVALAKLAHRQMSRVSPPGVKDWNDFFLAGNTAANFEQLLTGGEVVDLRLMEKQSDNSEIGRHAANPISIAGSFHDNHLFEVAQTLVRDIDAEAGHVVERYETVVIRSDNTMHRARRMPAPKGTADAQMTWRLQPDGALLDGPPKHNPFTTWQWSSIQDYLEKKSSSPELKSLIARVKQHLKASTWLPFEDDYTLLACTAVVTYVQAIFDAVPLILVTGAAGSGKTQLGIAMSEVSANSPGPVGQISPASIARLIDQARGFVVLDDLESVGRKNSDGQFDELIQTLKLSYNKQSATKYWTNMKTGKLEKLNFFGVKLINNTRGVDAILGSRMLKILTKKLPDGQHVSSDGRLMHKEYVQLRNDLHTWAFVHAKNVFSMYSTIYPNRTGRSDEISAPLRVISALAGDVPLAESLERALKRQDKLDIEPENPEQVLREALERIIRRSLLDLGVVQTVVSITQTMMEMALLVDHGYGKDFTTEMAEIEKPEWVGRHLRQNYTDPTSEQIRTQMFGKFLRSYKLQPDFVDKVVAQAKEEMSAQGKGIQMSVDPKAFCAGCEACPYRNRCDMQQKREEQYGLGETPGRAVHIAKAKQSVSH